MLPVVTEELPEDWEEAAAAADAADEGTEAATEAAAVTEAVDHAASVAAPQADAAIGSAAPTDACGQQAAPTLEANVSSKQQHGAAVSAAAEQVEPGSDAAADEGLVSSAGGRTEHDDRAAEAAEGDVAFGEGDAVAAGDKDEADVAAGAQPPVPSSVEATQVEAAQPESISARLQGHQEDLAAGHESDDHLPGQQFRSDCGNGIAMIVQGKMGQGEQRAVALDEMMDGEPVGSAIHSDAGSSPHDVGEEIVWMQDSIANTVQAGSRH